MDHTVHLFGECGRRARHGGWYAPTSEKHQKNEEGLWLVGFDLVTTTKRKVEDEN